MPINHWPTSERPRERLLTHGARALSVTELIAILFGNGTAGLSAIDLARELLQQHPSLQQLSQISPTVLCQHKGIGVSHYTRLQAAFELGRRLLSESLPQHTAIRHHGDVEAFLQAQLGQRSEEHFGCLFLDTQYRVIAYELLFSGDLSSTAIYPRVIAKKALDHHAKAVIIAHNHPSGNPTPSQMDIDMTQHLKKALGLLEIELLDHVVIGADGTASVSNYQ